MAGFTNEDVLNLRKLSIQLNEIKSMPPDEGTEDQLVTIELRIRALELKINPQG